MSFKGTIKQINSINHYDHIYNKFAGLILYMTYENVLIDASNDERPQACGI